MRGSVTMEKNIFPPNNCQLLLLNYGCIPSCLACTKTWLRQISHLLSPICTSLLDHPYQQLNMLQCMLYGTRSGDFSWPLLFLLIPLLKTSHPLLAHISLSPLSTSDRLLSPTFSQSYYQQGYYWPACWQIQWSFFSPYLLSLLTKAYYFLSLNTIFILIIQNRASCYLTSPLLCFFFFFSL